MQEWPESVAFFAVKSINGAYQRQLNGWPRLLPHVEIVPRELLDAPVHLLSYICIVGRLIDMTQRPKGRPDINVPEVGNDADNEPVNICRRVSVEITKGRLDRLGFGNVSGVHRAQ